MWKPRTIVIVSLVGFIGLSAIVTSNPSSEAPSLVASSPEPTATSTSTPAASATATEPVASGEESDDAALVQEPGTNQDQTNRLTELLSGMTISAEITSGYDRDLFKHWIDADGDGCNAREEVLIIESLITATTGSGCSVLTGSWFSAYDALTITESSKLDIDHMIPLKEAWDSGANTWSADRRQAFANDLDLPQALIAVSAGSNRSKSARDPAEWLPTNISYRCQYVEDWMVVKTKWDLSVDAREFEALRSVSVGCVN